jgi:hypothetical protein
MKCEQTYSLEKDPQDISSWIIKAVVEKDPSASPTDKSLHDDGRLMIIAGRSVFHFLSISYLLPLHALLLRCR